MAGIKRRNAISIDEKIDELREMKDALKQILEGIVDEFQQKMAECDQQIAYLHFLQKTGESE